MLHDGTAPGARPAVRRTALWGTQWGQMDSVVVPVVALLRDAAPLGAPAPRSVYNSAGALPWSGAARAVAFKIVTWLILPVVICLSQRLSHACLSISNYIVKLRMAH